MQIGKRNRRMKFRASVKMVPPCAGRNFHPCLQGSHDRTIRCISVIRDITERKRAEQALQESQRLLQLVMDNIPQAVFWKDKELTYLGTNQAFAEDAGFTSPQDLVGKTDFDMPWKEQAELYRADDQRVLELGEAKTQL